jgi:hypothetical protein
MNLLTWLTAQAAGLGLETDMSPKQTGSVDDDAGPNADRRLLLMACRPILQMKPMPSAWPLS